MASQVTQRVFETNSAPVKVSNHVAKATPEQKADREAFVQHEMASDRLSQIRTEQKRLAAEAKELRENQPSKLAKELERQEHGLPSWFGPYHTNLVKNRVRYGQQPEEAIEAVISLIRAHIATGLAKEKSTKPATTDSVE